MSVTGPATRVPRAPLGWVPRIVPELDGVSRMLVLPVVLTRDPMGVFEAMLADGASTDSGRLVTSVLHATAPMARTRRLAAVPRRRVSRRESLKVKFMIELLPSGGSIARTCPARGHDARRAAGVDLDPVEIAGGPASMVMGDARSPKPRSSASPPFSGFALSSVLGADGGCYPRPADHSRGTTHARTSR